MSERGKLPTEIKIDRARVVVTQLSAGTRTWNENAELAIRDALDYAERDIRTLLRDLDHERQTFPSEGIFEVRHGRGGKSYMRIAKLGEVPDPLRFASVARHLNTIAQAIAQFRDEARQTDGDGLTLIPSPWTEAEYVVRALEAAER